MSPWLPVDCPEEEEELPAMSLVAGSARLSGGFCRLGGSEVS